MEEQFQTVMESEDETKWLPVQILDAVYWTPNLPDDQQVEVMKVSWRFAHSLFFVVFVFVLYCSIPFNTVLPLRQGISR